MMEAQRYPADFNGILAGVAANWDQFMVAQMWPQLVMEWDNDFLPTCNENLVNSTLQAMCHDQDGQVDGVFDRRTGNVLGVLRQPDRHGHPVRHVHRDRCPGDPGDLAGSALVGLCRRTC